MNWIARDRDTAHPYLVKVDHSSDGHHRVALCQDPLGLWVTVQRSGDLVLWINAQQDERGAHSVFEDLVNMVLLDALPILGSGSMDFGTLEGWHAYLKSLREVTN